MTYCINLQLRVYGSGQERAWARTFGVNEVPHLLRLRIGDKALVPGLPIVAASLTMSATFC